MEVNKGHGGIKLLTL